MVMKSTIFLIFILLNLNNAYAQDISYVEKKEFNAEIQKNNDAMMQLKKSNAELKETVNGQNKKIDDLHRLIETKEELIQKNVDTVKQETQTRMLDIDQKISVRTVLWIVITIIVLLVSSAVYIILRKKLVLSSRTLDEQIIKTRETLETEAMKLDNKLMEAELVRFRRRLGAHIIYKQQAARKVLRFHLAEHLVRDLLGDIRQVPR